MQKTALKIPLHLIILDGLGAIILGVGLVKQFANINILPASLQFESDGMILAAVGALLMAPMLLFVIKSTQKKAEKL